MPDPRASSHLCVCRVSVCETVLLFRRHILLLVLVLRSLAMPVLSATTASSCPVHDLRAFRTRDEKEGGSRFEFGCPRSWQKTRLSARALPIARKDVLGNCNNCYLGVNGGCEGNRNGPQAPHMASHDPPGCPQGDYGPRRELIPTPPPGWDPYHSNQNVKRKPP